MSQHKLAMSCLKLPGLCHDKAFLVSRQLLNTLQLKYLNSMSRQQILYRDYVSFCCVALCRDSVSHSYTWYVVATNVFFVATQSSLLMVAS